MRLELGRVYSLPELEARCGGTGDAPKYPERRRLLYERLANPDLFEAADLSDVLQTAKQARHQTKLPQWVRAPVYDPLPGKDMKDFVMLKRQVASRIAVGFMKEAAAADRGVSSKDVLTALLFWGFARNAHRLNVLPEGQDWVYSDTLGLGHARNGRPVMSSATRENKWFTLLLVQWLKDNWPPELPRDWPFTSISVNCD